MKGSKECSSLKHKFNFILFILLFTSQPPTRVWQKELLLNSLAPFIVFSAFFAIWKREGSAGKIWIPRACFFVSLLEEITLKALLCASVRVKIGYGSGLHSKKGKQRIARLKLTDPLNDLFIPFLNELFTNGDWGSSCWDWNTTPKTHWDSRREIICIIHISPEIINLCQGRCWVVFIFNTSDSVAFQNL